MARLELALPMAGVLLAACAPAPVRLTPEQLNDYAASLKIAPASTPATEPTKIPVLPTRETPRTVPGAGGGFAPDLPVPSATPRPPEATPTIAITLPDGAKATVIIPPPTPMPATATPMSQVGIREYTPPLANFTDVLAMPGWSKYPDVIKRLPNNSLQISTPGTEMRVINTDYIEVGDKGFEVKVKMNTVNNNNPAGVVSAIVLLNKTIHVRESNPLQIEIGFDNNRNLLVHLFDFWNQDRNRRSIHLLTDKNGIKLSSNELRIQFIGVGAEERINIYDGATGKLLAENIQLPNPFFTEKSNRLFFGFYPQSIWNGPVMTVHALQAATY